jgi:hypothetical protein
VAGCWPGQVKVEKIDSFWLLTLVLFAAALGASIPKHFVARVFRLDVAARSFESKCQHAAFRWLAPSQMHMVWRAWARA